MGAVSVIAAPGFIPFAASAGELGKMTREVWSGIPGSSLSAFTSSARYWQAADSTTTFSGSVAPEDLGENCASRTRTYIIAPATGIDTFRVSSSGDSQLQLSSSISKFDRVGIASVSGGTDRQVWDAMPSQKSVAIPLIGGRRYFLEVLQKQQTAGAHCALAWEVSGGVRELMLPATLGVRTEI